MWLRDCAKGGTQPSAEETTKMAESARRVHTHKKAQAAARLLVHLLVDAQLAALGLAQLGEAARRLGHRLAVRQLLVRIVGLGV